MDEWGNVYVIAGENTNRPENASMVASNSFKELSEVLARIESSGTTVQHAEMDQDLSSTDGDVTADLAVTVPILTDEDTGEAVSIDAKDAAIEDGEVSVDLTVTVSASDSKSTGHVSRTCEPATTGDESSVETVPAYKNPDALQTVYEQYSSFPEMTEALGVDVTSETVRRHMIEYDIHDPDDTRPKSYIDAMASKETSDNTDTTEFHAADTTGTETESPSGADPETGVLTADEQTDTSSGVSDEVATQEATSAVTDGGNVTVDSATKGSPFATTLVSELVAEVSPQQCTDPTVRPDIDLPETLTVAELADAIDQSQTVHGVTQHIGVNRSAAKQFLEKFGLIDLVSHRLAADQITVSPDEVVRRINAASQ